MGKALLIIDMQRLMQDRIDAGRDCVHPAAPLVIAELAAGFLARGWPVVHIRHGDSDPASPLHADAPGAVPMDCARAVGEEAVFVKNTSSAFASTGLEAHLRAQGIRDLVVCGAVAGFCVNSAVRAGADLGFGMRIVPEAVIGFDLPEAGLSARVIFDVTMAHLAADFASVVTAEMALA